MEKKKQVFRFNDAELSLIKNSFAESDELLFAIRKVFLQMPLSDVDKSLLATFKGNKELLAVLRKTFNPQIEPDAPLHQLIDLWMSVDLKERPIHELAPVFEGRKLLIELLEQQLNSLESVIKGKEVEEEIKFTDLVKLAGKETEVFYSHIIARNTLISHVEAQLSQINILAGKKDDSVEQTKEKLLKNSNK